MFRKVLIANRGEIARRVARTCRRMGVAVATVHSEADRDAPHVRDIGESVLLGAAPARESYLDIARVVDAARRVGADAVHPGYGFLAENAAFAEALEREGIAFVGPTPQVLRDFGDKAAAKRLAQAAGVPTIPGSPRASRDADEVAAMTEALGFPALLKAAAGGGGKGIRVLHSPASLHDAIAGAMREGLNAFGDPSLLVERYLPHGRHVEVQILGDGRGRVLHLWERECSLQRRHQKIVEEAPALPMPAGMRERMLQAAVALGRHVAYRALGTVEFLVAGGEFFFLEVNPRLQVEHPVTECITGLDLVELQLRAAAGAPIGLEPDGVRCDGHAIEVRVCTEDPDQGFVPSTGVVRALALPHGAVRVESGVEAGSAITPHYDPMVAKLVAHGGDRAEAIARMREALGRTRLCGVASNLGFLEALLRAPSVVDAVPDTGTVDAIASESPPAAAGWRADAPRIAAALALSRARDPAAAGPASGWSALTHWRLGGGQACRPQRPQYAVHAAGRGLAAAVGTVPSDPALFLVDVEGRETAVRIADPAPDGGTEVTVDGVAWRLWLGVEGESVWISDGRATEFVRVTPALRPDRSADAARAATVVAPLTGKVLEVRASAGQRVDAGEVLVVIESMKMEMRITAPHAGVVGALRAAVGATVERGAELVTVDAEGAPE